MKTLLVTLLTITFFACTPQKEYMVQSEENLTTEFDKYSSFEFSTHALGTNTTYTLNDLVVKQIIRDAVEDELEAKGYVRAPNNGDLIVNFRVFEDETTIRGFENDPEYWLESEVRSWEDVQTYNVEPGTVYVDIVDKQSSTMVWRGFATGLVEGDTFIKDPDAINGAVENIFERFDHRANELK